MVLSVPSYVIPGTYAENALYLRDKPAVQGIELLFYYFDAETEELFRRERRRIEALRERFVFTAHLPDPLLPEHEAVMGLCDSLVRHYVVHTPDEAGPAFFDMIRGWRDRYGDRFLLENLIDREFTPVLEGFTELPICLDVGHALMRGDSIEAFLEQYGARIREIHLHGVEEGVDHRPFSNARPVPATLVPFLREFRGVVDMELFSVDHVRDMLAHLADRGIVPPGGGWGA